MTILFFCFNKGKIIFTLLTEFLTFYLNIIIRKVYKVAFKTFYKNYLGTQVARHLEWEHEF